MTVRPARDPSGDAARTREIPGPRRPDPQDDVCAPDGPDAYAGTDEDLADPDTDDAAADDDAVDAAQDDDLDPAFATAAPSAPALDERARRMLAFERRWWRRPGAKEQAIMDTFGLTPTRYYQLLNALVDDPAALAYDPLLVGRLRRLRQRRRAGGTVAPGAGR